MHRPPTARLLATTTLVAVALVLGACGGGDDSASTTTVERISLSDWTDEVNTLCNEAQDRIDQLEEPAGPDDFEVIASSGSDIVDEAEAFVGDVEALGSPDESAVDAKKFVNLYTTYATQLQAVVDAAEDEDEAGVEDALSELDANVTERDELADELGLTECVSTEDDATEDTLAEQDDTTTTVEDGSASGNLAPAEWASEIDAACLRLSEKYGSIGSSDPTTPEEVTALANDLNAFATEVVGEFDRIGPPEGDTTQAQALYDQFVALQESTTALANAAATQDVAATEAAVAGLDAAGQAINPLATELGVDSCGGF
jgi:hypothetical protein